MKTITPFLPRCLAILAQTALLSLAFCSTSPPAGAQTGNTATGQGTLLGNTGDYNTGDGFYALASGNSGDKNTAVGVNVLVYNTNGDLNAGSGAEALFSNTSGAYNTASGATALYGNTNGFANTATGYGALYQNTTAGFNTASGSNALGSHTTGKNNIALGYNAGYNLTTDSNNIDVGALGVAGESGKIRIGTKTTQTATYIAGISGKTVASATGVAVRIDATGKLGTVLSSARYKDNIKPMEKASEALLKLEPVSFRYKEELDPNGVRQFGLIAEQVEKIDPDLVVRDEDGKVSTVRYEAVNAMLLNEFLKEHRKVEEQRNEFEAKFAKQQKQIEALSSGLQKVIARMKLDKPGHRVTANDRTRK